MGSVVVSDVVSHFPNSMFGASRGHHQSQESPTAVHQQRSTAPKTEYSDLNKNQAANSRAASSSADVPMSDAGSQETHRSQQNTTLQNPHSHPSADHPESPRIRHTYPPSEPTHSSQAGSAPVSAVSPNSVGSGQPAPALGTASSASPTRIKVHSLSHIQSFATDESSPFSLTRSSSRRARRDPSDIGPQYEISEMPVTDIIEMVAGLLTKITSTNDRQHEHLHRQIPSNTEGGAPSTAHMSQQTSSVLAFHGKNVPSISILSYLSRIHKYCPTTYEVFLSLLVYFDRMTERVNAGPLQSLRRASQQNLHQSRNLDNSRNSSVSSASVRPTAPQQDPTQLQAHPPTPTPPPSGSFEKPAESGTTARQDQHSPLPSHPPGPEPPLDADPYNLSHFFVVDSFNIHRLVIAGVTCASKFFSDIFYTNSRYAKVGGLPLFELNHLELQFLLLNDFRLSVPLEEMEAYGTMLVEFYAREVVAQQQHHVGGAGGLASS